MNELLPALALVPYLPLPGIFKMASALPCDMPPQVHRSPLGSPSQGTAFSWGCGRVNNTHSGVYEADSVPFILMPWQLNLSSAKALL